MNQNPKKKKKSLLTGHSFIINIKGVGRSFIGFSLSKKGVFICQSYSLISHHFRLFFQVYFSDAFNLFICALNFYCRMNP